MSYISESLKKAFAQKNASLVMSDLKTSVFSIDECETIFTEANKAGFIDVVRYCVEVGLKNRIMGLIPRMEKINLIYQGQRGLALALEFGYPGLVDFYLSKGVPCAQSKEALFLQAAASDQFLMVSYWVQSHKVEADYKQSIALFEALANSRFDMARHLCQLGAKVRDNPGPKFYDYLPNTVLRSERVSDEFALSLFDFYLTANIRYEPTLRWLADIALVSLKRVEYVLSKNLPFSVEGAEAILRVSFKSPIIFLHCLQLGFDPSINEGEFILRAITKNFPKIAFLLLLGQDISVFSNYFDDDSVPQVSSDVYFKDASVPSLSCNLWTCSIDLLEKILNALADNSSKEFRVLTNIILTRLGYECLDLVKIGGSVASLEEDWWIGKRARDYALEIKKRLDDGPIPGASLVGERIRLLYLEEKITQINHEPGLRLLEETVAFDASILCDMLKTNYGSPLLFSFIHKTIDFQSIESAAELELRKRLIVQRDSLVFSELSCAKQYFILPYLERDKILLNIARLK